MIAENITREIFGCRSYLKSNLTDIFSGIVFPADNSRITLQIPSATPDFTANTTVTAASKSVESIIAPTRASSFDIF